MQDITGADVTMTKDRKSINIIETDPDGALVETMIPLTHTRRSLNQNGVLITYQGPSVCNLTPNKTRVVQESPQFEQYQNRGISPRLHLNIKKVKDPRKFKSPKR
jgi:hypothetical protein